MIDVSQLSTPHGSVSVLPSNNLFRELGRNTYDFKDLLSELIDNSLAARVPGSRLNISIDIFKNEANQPVKFVISDNAAGIPVDKLGAAITPAGVQTAASLNEHGLGMKQAVAGLGRLEYLATRTMGESEARVIREFKFGDIEVFSAPFSKLTGTEISVTDPRAIVSVNSTNYTRTIIPYLGARYRRFLSKTEHDGLDLTVCLRSTTNPSVCINEGSQYVRPVKPVYFHPQTRNNEPVILKYPIRGDHWEAELTFGYAPTRREEYEELDLEIPTKFHPYHVSLNRQGLDIIIHNRVVLFHQLNEINLVPNRHNDFNPVRGEIDLKSGFVTAITKNSIIGDANFNECLELIKSVLSGEAPGPKGHKRNYLQAKTYPAEIPERLLRDRLAKWLETNPLHPRSEVKKEYSVGGIEGNIDILADDEAWELKVGQASAYDVYQLFMYMDIGGVSKGFLVAQGFTGGAMEAASHVASHHDKHITLAPKDQFPINSPPTDEERNKYY